jgi:hypothetical protein
MGSRAVFFHSTILQETTCTIVNNSNTDISLVGVKSAIFHNSTSYAELLLEDNLIVEVAPAYLRRGEYYKFNTIYYAPMGFDVSIDKSGKCAPPAATREIRTPISAAKVCENSKPTGKNPLEYFYGGVGWDLYTFNHSGLVFQLGDGRHIYYSPAYELTGYMKAKQETHHAFDSLYSPEIWGDPPAFLRPLSNLLLIALFLFGFYGLRSLVRLYVGRKKKSTIELVEIPNEKSKANM